MAGKGDELRQRILAAYDQYERRNRIPPSVREVARAVGIKSTAHASYHLSMLEKAGLLTRTPGAARGRQLAQRPGVQVHGTIAAGVPLTVYEPGEREHLDLGQHLREADAERAEFALLVQGDSMVEEHIFDGDYVLVRPGSDAPNGAIVVALHLAGGDGQGAATVKRFHRDRARRVVRLEPANPAFATRTIPADEWDREWTIRGTVTAIHRPCPAKPAALRRPRTHQAAGER